MAQRPAVPPARAGGLLWGWIAGNGGSRRIACGGVADRVIINGELGARQHMPSDEELSERLVMTANQKYVRLPLAIVVLFAFSGMQPARAATLTWTGSGGDDLLSTAANWNPSQAPVGGDTLNIGTGDTVKQENNLPSSSTINLTGSSSLSTQASVIRLNDSTLNVGSGSSLVGAFWDLDGASITFADGAIATMANWEQKDFNTFTYQLGASGFTALTPGTFRLGTGGAASASIANATYVVDFAAFTGGAGSYSITLMDFASDAAGLTNATFQTASFSYLNDGNISSPSITWDDPTDTMTLSFIVAVPEPSTLALFGTGLLGVVLVSRHRRAGGLVEAG
jgi:hypothetical protein